MSLNKGAEPFIKKCRKFCLTPGVKHSPSSSITLFLAASTQDVRNIKAKIDNPDTYFKHSTYRATLCLEIECFTPTPYSTSRAESDCVHAHHHHEWRQQVSV